MTMTSESGAAALVMYRLGGRDYPQKTVAQCKVCQSPYRYEIEQQVVKGRVYRIIAESLPPDADVSMQSVRTHYRNGHMPLDVEVARRTVEKLAVARGQSVEDDIDGIVDGITLATMVVQKAFEALVTGELKPDLKEGLAAAKLIEDYGVRDGGMSEVEYAQAFMEYHESARLAMSPQQFEQFGRILSANPVLRALADKAADRERGIVDAEIVYDEVEVVYEDEADPDAQGDDGSFQLVLTEEVPQDTSNLQNFPPAQEQS